MKMKLSIGSGCPAMSFVFAISAIVVGFGVCREADADRFQLSDKDVIEEHYNECRNRYGPQLTRADAAKLDQNCNPMPEKPPKPGFTPDEMFMPGFMPNELKKNRVPEI